MLFEGPAYRVCSERKIPLLYTSHHTCYDNIVLAIFFVLQSKAKSEGCTPVGSPRKWDHVERSKSLAIESGKIDILSSDDEQEQPVRPRQRSLKKKKTGFTTTPSSEQLASLPLKPGANTVMFSVTTKYQVGLQLGQQDLIASRLFAWLLEANGGELGASTMILFMPAKNMVGYLRLLTI